MTDLHENYRGVFDGHIEFGERPVILVVDFIKAYTTQGSPLYAEPVVGAVEETVELLSVARAVGVPIVYTKGLYHASGIDGGMFLRKVPVLRTLVHGEPLADIVDDLAPAPRDLVIAKNYASAFFGTTLAPTLHGLGIDTIVLVGCSTSGCIRATAVDGIQHGFAVFVPRECVGDRHSGPHEASLFDIAAKYGEVLPKTDVTRRLAGVAPARAR